MTYQNAKSKLTSQNDGSQNGNFTFNSKMTIQRNDISLNDVGRSNGDADETINVGFKCFCCIHLKTLPANGRERTFKFIPTFFFARTSLFRETAAPPLNLSFRESEQNNRSVLKHRLIFSVLRIRDLKK
jgi:hypothetical protein